MYIKKYRALCMYLATRESKSNTYIVHLVWFIIISGQKVSGGFGFDCDQVIVISKPDTSVATGQGRVCLTLD